MRRATDDVTRASSGATTVRPAWSAGRVPHLSITDRHCRKAEADRSRRLGSPTRETTSPIHAPGPDRRAVLARAPGVSELSPARQCGRAGRLPVADAGHVISPQRPGRRCIIDPKMASGTILLPNGNGAYLFPKSSGRPRPQKPVAGSRPVGQELHRFQEDRSPQTWRNCRTGISPRAVDNRLHANHRKETRWPPRS
jgi:hypothetical protein